MRIRLTASGFGQIAKPDVFRASAKSDAEKIVLGSFVCLLV